MSHAPVFCTCMHFYMCAQALRAHVHFAPYDPYQPPQRGALYRRSTMAKAGKLTRVNMSLPLSCKLVAMIHYGELHVQGLWSYDLMVLTNAFTIIIIIMCTTLKHGACLLVCLCACMSTCTLACACDSLYCVLLLCPTNADSSHAITCGQVCIWVGVWVHVPVWVTVKVKVRSNPMRTNRRRWSPLPVSLTTSHTHWSTSSSS